LDIFILVRLRSS